MKTKASGQLPKASAQCSANARVRLEYYSKQAEESRRKSLVKDALASQKA